MQDEKKVIYEDLVYVLNEEDKTATVVDHKKRSPFIYIPKYIIINSLLYLITSIAEYAFQFGSLKTLIISKFAKIKSIGESAFDDSHIESIQIPSSVSDLSKYWNNGLYYLKEIKVIDTDERNIKYINNKYLVGKSNKNSDVFDVLLFARRDIEEGIIPPQITRIATNAFAYCQNLEKIKISDKCKLQTIEDYAFMNSSVKYLEIPSNIINLMSDWNNGMDHLKFIKIIKNGDENVKILNCQYLVGKTDLKSDIFDILFFAYRNIRQATIPSCIKIISNNAFKNCYYLSRVIFPNDSQLQSIGDFAFYKSFIQSLLIPSSVQQIGCNAFALCDNLKSIKFKENSKIHSIGSNAFWQSSIEYLKIPSSIKDLKNDWCEGTSNLNKIEVIQNGEENIKLDNKLLVGKTDIKSDAFNTLIFAPRLIRKVVIPAYIKIIGSYAFEDCKKLFKVEFEKNSSLEKIKKGAFSGSFIYRIFIPSNVEIIKSYAFSECINLSFIEFPENSKLKYFDNNILSHSAVEEISIPSEVTVIYRNAFDLCGNLKRIKFQKNSHLKSIQEYALGKSHIKSIEIPSSVENIENDALHGLVHLKGIKVVKNNEVNIKFYNNEFLVGKTDLSSDIFDVIHFVESDIKEAIIPAQIKRITPFLFSKCKKIHYISFHDDSQLQSIETCAFLSTPIKSISFPPKLTYVEFNAFSECKKLKLVEFTSKLSFDCIHQNLLFDIDDCIFMVSCS